MPSWVAVTTTRRQLSMAASIALRKYGATISVGRSASESNASLIRLRNLARMMQPPRQMVAMSPGGMPQSYSALPAWVWLTPWAEAMTFEAYSALLTSAMNGVASLGFSPRSPDASPVVALRWATEPD